MDAVEKYLKTEQEQKKDKFLYLNELAVKGETLFVGSSLMEQFPVNELLMSRGMNKIIYNRGIGGYTTKDMLGAMDEMIFGLLPSRIFINIGTNDIGAAGYQLDNLINNYREILVQIKERLPEAAVYLLAYYPVNETDKVPDSEWGRHLFDTRNNENIHLANKAVEELAESMGYQYIDISAGLRDERGMLKKEYTVEGVHMYANAYHQILDNLVSYL